MKKIKKVLAVILSGMLIAGIAAGEGTEIITKNLGFEKSGYEVTLSELNKRLNNTV